LSQKDAENAINNKETTMAIEINKGSRKLLVSAISVVLGGWTAEYGFAQEQEGAIEEISVTGSRIRQSSGMITPTPVTAVTITELAVFDPGGTVAEQLNSLPQFFGNRSAQSSTGALNAGSGSSFLNLRDLGSNRTLVLFDGSRVVPADITGSVGIDTFPTALISTVDVVTGGASAAYGADALGGVVNFVLNREFEGLKFEAGTGITEQKDGQRWNVSVAGGKQIGDRLHLIGSVEALQIKQILRDPTDLDDDWWQRWGWVTNPDWVSAAATPNEPQRLTLPWVSSTEHTPTGMIWARTRSSSTAPLIPFALNGMTFTDDGTAVRPFIQGDVYAAPNRTGSTKSMSGGPEGEIANRAFENGPYGAETVTRSMFTGAKYDFSDSLSGFAQIMVGRAETNSPGRRSQYFLRDTWHATIFRDNAFLPASVAAAMDAAGIDSFQLHKAGAFKGDNNVDEGDGKEVFTTYSWSVGFDAVLPNDWDLRASWQSGKSDNRAGLYGQIRIDRMFLGMDAVRDPNTGAIVCRVQLYNPTPEQLATSSGVEGKTSITGGPLLSPIGLDNTVRDCVPYNVMGAGNMSQAAVDYTQSDRIELSTVDQDFAELLVSGELFQGWSGPISFAAGLTWREQGFEQIVLSDVYDLGPPQNAPEYGIQGISSGYSGGSGTLHKLSSQRNARGDLDVWEWFTELNVPIWQAQSGSQRLDTTLAYRSSDYSRSGRIESWKLGADFQVLEDLRLRATKSRDVREPTFTELFNNRGGGGANIDVGTGPALFITASSDGNPNLRPEIGDTKVVGFVYQPGFVPGLQFSADWYDVKIKDSVGSLGPQRIYDECTAGNTAFCASIDRDASGVVTLIRNGYINVNAARVRGVDVESSYRADLDLFADRAESLTIRLLAGYIKERSDTPLGGSLRDVSGELGSPDLTANATLSYSVGDYSIRLQQRFVDDTIRDIDWVEGVDVDDNSVSSGNYTSLGLGYGGETSNGGTWNITLNVNNLFDRPPPIVASYATSGAAQSIPNGYDLYGRRYQLSFNTSF
jgi:outer membrane receptor protein involved in Fe transport